MEIEMEPVQIHVQFESPPTTMFHSPSKRAMARSEELLSQVMHPRLMKQERLHSLSKRPQVRCFAAEADLTIQKVMSSTQSMKGVLGELEEQFHGLEGKVDKLELEFENGQKHHMIHQLSFSPGTGLSPPPTPDGKRASFRQGKLRGLSLFNLKESSLMMSPSSPDYILSSPMMEYSRKRRLLELCLNRLLTKMKGEAEILQGMFDSNFKVLKFQRAENCVLSMIKLQRKLRGCQDSVCQLRDRLLHIQ